MTASRYFACSIPVALALASASARATPSDLA